MTNKLGVVLVLCLVLASAPVYAETSYGSVFDTFLESFSMFFKFSSNGITGNQLMGGGLGGGVCIPITPANACGDDGCGTVSDECEGSIECGICSEGETCVSNVCVATCTSDCTDKTCGDDGCGGSCGSCSDGETCDTSGQCVATCTPQFTLEEACEDKGLDCGTVSDGCDGIYLCGLCDDGETCKDNVCSLGCVSDCTDKTCGDDGCGGSCGSCTLNEYCWSDSCVPNTNGGDEDCTNRIDDDNDCPGDTNGNGLSCDPGDIGVDCLDLGCKGSTNCYGWGYTYCESDDDCSGMSGTFCDVSLGICGEKECDNEKDDDEDGFEDCDDWDCALDTTSSNNCAQHYSPGGSETDCEDGYDNDLDYSYDCDDTDCEDESICEDLTGWDGGDYAEGSVDDTESICDDGIDNDGDDDIDCDDTECYWDPACHTSGSGTGSESGTTGTGTATQSTSPLSLEDKGEIATKLERMNNKFEEITQNLYQLEKEFRKAKEQLDANNIRVIVKEITTIQELITVLLNDPYISDAEYGAKLASIQNKSKVVIEEIKLI